MKIIPYDCYNRQHHTGAGIIGTVVQHFGRWGMTNGWKIIEIYETADSTDRDDMEE